MRTYVANISGARLPIRAEAEDGAFFIIHAHQRYTRNRTGKPVTDDGRLHQVVTQLQGTDDASGAPGK